LDGASYAVDAVGNRTSKTDQLSGATSNFTYDAIYQLTQAVQGLNTTESYTYDAVGNRLSSLGASPYSYNSSNELTAKPGVAYTYDSNGNTLTKVDSTGTTTDAWDFENRLTSVTLPGSGGTVSFKYDPFGRRIQKSSASGTTDYLYDGANVIEEVDSSGAVLARYTQGSGLDEPLAVLRSGTTTYYEADGLGSVTSLSNSTGALANTYTYDSFGNLSASTGTVTNPLRYTAREFESETGLYYYRARYYDSGTGRFLGEDPLKVNGVPKNVYGYVLNNPVRYVDPDGLSAHDVRNIENQARNDIDAMTGNGQRIDPGWLNNVESSLQHLNPFRKKPPLLGCGQQADRIASDLQFRRYDDHWDFKVEQDGLFHQRGRATSSNPSDPDIIFDPWYNRVYTVPKGGK